MFCLLVCLFVFFFFSLKAASSGFFKKPNWHQAAASYVKAALAFKLAKERDACVQAHLRAADAFSKAEGGLKTRKAHSN
jgi:hypothetical protein